LTRWFVRILLSCHSSNVEVQGKSVALLMMVRTHAPWRIQGLWRTAYWFHNNTQVRWRVLSYCKRRSAVINVSNSR